jgi:hypothetical protein
MRRLKHLRLKSLQRVQQKHLQRRQRGKRQHLQRLGEVELEVQAVQAVVRGEVVVQVGEPSENVKVKLYKMKSVKKSFHQGIQIMPNID